MLRRWLGMGIVPLALALGGCTPGVSTPTATVSPTAAAVQTATPVVTAPTATPLVQSPTATSATPALPPSPTTAAPATPTAGATSSPATATARWQIYHSATYGVTLRYPASWQLDPRYAGPDRQRFDGPDGFVELAATDGQSLAAAADREAHQPLQPYGAHPTISALQLQGQAARLILPSPDQPAPMQHQAALIIQAPRPIVINGQTYPFLVIWADEAHLRAIAATLRFDG